MTVKNYNISPCVASEDFMNALLVDNNGWASAVFSQIFGLSDKTREALYAGEAEWKILDRFTITITQPD